ncbi:MAG: hypothetical protein A3C50_02980 [Candidatus Staskawiczbacteria bacterium RIFCSPHIGHO2_02_FULL_43_16]|uniref:DNA primase/polymerase bifunctional N-terminal domain-containing protein n=1 Tax=Candidatus Staskawiczbacteria bacterium RIFCSPHIGHO2_01_FULL_41_41 TaxID=1802203 RepID=A0A1G2HSI6_9BACT|nr:MAG: hypothetical protein A2822_01115 [Candidatus Staskawiczbacteria bacterium RIFCSPHIGHO2_01_FULL_41_41]OGZ68579.1 MAG: hypothetical protein A3C50_02980 [Candidatus Staskawiczbacteria bacterium RIFCSPHIGHO2_02_FULL_43_16]
MKIQELKTNLDWALYYRSIGWSAFPIKSRDKTPIFKWEKYQTEIATEEQMRQWWKQFPDASIGVATGKVSGIVVVDIEAGGSITDLPPTVMARSGGGGFHFFYKHPGAVVKNRVRILDKTDIRGDGGYIVVTPSLHKSGKRYEWAVDPESAKLEEFPHWIVEKCTESAKTKVDWNNFLSADNSKGTRNQQAAALAGKILYHNPIEMWDVIGWPALQEWNRIKNSPPLSEKEIKSVWESIKKAELERRVKRDKENSGDNRKSQSEKLMRTIDQQERIVLFHNELKEPFIRVPIKNHEEIWSCRSKMFKRWLAKVYWEEHRKAINSENLHSTINMMESQACFSGNQYTLHNRSAWYENAIWYDLSDSEWQAVKITTEGWEVIKNTPILFKRYSHQQAQVEPVQGGDIKDILKFINIQNEDQKILLLVWVVSCFIPDFPHPIPNFYGAQGSAKSLMCKILRKIIDPSAIEVLSFPKDIQEFVQIMAHHACIFFDNVSHLSDHISDALCKAVTGDGFSKRELYSDEDDIIFSFRRCLGINGINIAAKNPDLLERSILFELERVPEEKRKQEDDILKEFENQRAQIMGSIFDVVVKALKIKESIKLNSLPRMADFAVWGSAIAEGIGYTKEQFLGAYYRSIKDQNSEVLYNSLVAISVIQFMKDKNEWSGTPSQLLEELKIAAGAQDIKVEKEKDFPKAANTLSRQLNKLKTNLADEGLEVKFGIENKSRKVYIRKKQKNIEGIDEPSREIENDENDILPNF